MHLLDFGRYMLVLFFYFCFFLTQSISLLQSNPDTRGKGIHGSHDNCGDSLCLAICLCTECQICLCDINI